VFIYLTVRSVNFDQVLAALTQTNYWLVALSAGVMMTLTVCGHALAFLARAGQTLHTRSLFPPCSSAMRQPFVPAIWVSSCGLRHWESMTSPPARLRLIVVERIVDVVLAYRPHGAVVIVHPSGMGGNQRLHHAGGALLLCAC